MKGKRKFFLRAWRERAGLTQQQLADATGHTKGYISNLERGASRYNEDVVEACARALRCEPGDLMREPDTAEVVSFNERWLRVPPDKREQALRILDTFAEGDDG